MKRHTLTILTSLLLLAGSASFAFALTHDAGSDFDPNECQIDDDCTGNLVCVDNQNGSCTAAPCEPGKECPAIECEDSSYKSCELPPPAACESDTDCTAGFVCLTSTYTTCSGGAAPDVICPDGDNDCETTPLPPEETECEQTHESYCVPPYVAPCTTDESCGAEGFTCKTVPVSCGCSSSGSTSPGSSTDVGSDDGTSSNGNTAPEDCNCPEPDESVRYCELQNISCTTDDECAGDFVCHRLSSPAPDSSCSFDPSTGVETCDDPNKGNNWPNLGRCAPADYPYWMGGNSHDSGGSTKNESDTDNNSNTGGQPGANSPGQIDDSNSSDDPDGCHIASLHTKSTGNTSTLAFLMAGAAAFVTLSRRRKR